MGHADYATTEKYYAQLTPDDTGIAIKVLKTSCDRCDHLRPKHSEMQQPYVARNKVIH